MGNHRTLPYTGLHYSKQVPKSGLGVTALVSAGSLLAAFVLLVLAYVTLVAYGVPIRVTEDGAPFHTSLFTIISGLWS
jgi:hypothetical protein